MDSLLKSEGLKAASDIAKQLISLSTGAVAFTVTFLEKFTTDGDHKKLSVPAGLYLSWAFFGLTVLFAILTLMAITGTLQTYDRKANNWTLSKSQAQAADGADGNVRVPAILMLLCFMIAVVAMIWAGTRL